MNSQNEKSNEALVLQLREAEAVLLYSPATIARLGVEAGFPQIALSTISNVLKYKPANSKFRQETLDMLSYVLLNKNDDGYDENKAKLYFAESIEMKASLEMANRTNAEQAETISNLRGLVDNYRKDNEFLKATITKLLGLVEKFDRMKDEEK